MISGMEAICTAKEIFLELIDFNTKSISSKYCLIKKRSVFRSFVFPNGSKKVPLRNFNLERILKTGKIHEPIVIFLSFPVTLNFLLL